MQEYAKRERADIFTHSLNSFESFLPYMIIINIQSHLQQEKHHDKKIKDSH